ncbi:Zn(II)2Cys6 transcription factor domain-containing protein [Aspergillus saccharolyticus JOP 1030-1]|uniref:Zn(2)-C6 fungal-type domain-containing protein n=1 Tax=Aspergillus saccharolyticus JOP 1030-1 TaxID=1450539 RepID=A0A318Z6C4_9EURO|nr:hypothetical protein BP01DRAFT_347657 [Aspergillus saccharolyticus JOP 1030-1]PYH41994.1 hypothetical protein BP01DRAFT_347657 [Aspergillus saccharolyticus JOP 1030-1]
MDQTPTQYDLSPAPYGRACMNCSRAKCKCILSKDGGQCQRCQRLNKECRPSAFQRRQNLHKATAPKSGRLEKKLDDVVALLRARAARSSAADEYADLIEAELSSTATGARPRSSRGVSRKTPSGESQSLRNPRTRVQSSKSIEQGWDGLADAADAALDLSPWQAEECLTAFLTQKLPYLPFIYFAPGTTARHLQRERPFMWLCVMAVASKSVKQRSALCDKVKEVVAQKAVLNYVGRDLDLLLGILIFIAWSGQQVFRKLSLIMFSQLALAVVYDLSLDKPSSIEGSLLLCLYSSLDDPPATPPARTKEERRAVLGCYLLTSSISLFFKKAESLRWTPYLEECLETLSRHPDCPNDEVLVHQVRCQLINERVNQTEAPPPHSHSTLMNPYSTLRAPVSTYQHALNSYLASAQTKFPPHTQEYKIIHLHNTHTTLSLTEPSLLHTTSTNTAPSPSANTSITTRLNLPHLETLSTALTATKAWFDTFLSIPPAEYTGFPFTVFAQLARTLAALYRLSTLEDPLWDRAGVRRELDVLEVLDSVIGNLGQAAALARLEGMRPLRSGSGSGSAGEGGEGDGEVVDDGEVFFYSVGKYESMRLAWQRRFGGGSGSGGEEPQGAAGGRGVLGQEFGAGAGLGALGLGVAYDDWMSEFLNSMVH